MKTVAPILLCALTALVLCSCGENRNEKTAAEEALTDISVFSDANAGLEPYRLCDAVLTSEEGMESAFPDSEEKSFEETTPATEAFYMPAADIKDKRLAKLTQLHGNYVAMFYRVVHAYECFERVSTDVGDEADDVTATDSLAWIRSFRPALSSSFIDRALPDPMARTRAHKLLAAYDGFDGYDGEDAPFIVELSNYSDALWELPDLVSDEQFARYREGYWDWYDKRNVVPEIDTLIRMNMHGYEGAKPTEAQLENFRRVIEAEKDIDRRTILALEYAKFDHWNSVTLLGEILESRIYTKYLHEAWYSWRANCQYVQSPSSFSVIANNYYDKMKAICLDTIVRHCLETEDEFAECLIQELVLCGIVHRMGSLFGNESIPMLVDLANEEFIHPRLLEAEE